MSEVPERVFDERVFDERVYVERLFLERLYVERVYVERPFPERVFEANACSVGPARDPLGRCRARTGGPPLPPPYRYRPNR